MIACRNCGQTYTDDATYCNVCGTDLNENTTDIVYDQGELTNDSIRITKRVTQIQQLLIAISVVSPFILFTTRFSLLPAIQHRLVYVVLVECAVILGLALLWKKQHSFNYVCWCVVILLCMLFPIGLIPAAIMAFLLIRD